MASKNPPLTDEQIERICELANEGFTPGQIGQELGINGRRISGYYTNLAKEGRITVVNHGKPRSTTATAVPPQSSVGELVEGIERLDELSDKRATRQAPAAPQSGKDPVEIAKGAIETGIALGRGGGNGNGQPQSELLQFLSTVVTQQREAHQNVMEQIQSRHDNDTARVEQEHEARMEEQRLKIEADRTREREYWKRIDVSRQEETKRREDAAKEERARIQELQKEERKFVTDKFDTVNAQVRENLEHANRLIDEREKSSDRHIEMQERFSAELRELRKEMGKGSDTEELVKYAIDKVGEPAIRAIEKRVGTNNAALSLAEGTKPTLKGADVGLGGAVGKVKAGLKNALIGRFMPFIKEGIEQLLKHLQKWPDVGMSVLVDWLWSIRMYTETAGYAQTAIAFIVLNDVDDLVKKAGSLLTDEARTLLASDKAKKWWAELQQAVNERINQEKQAREAYDAYTHQGEKEESPEEKESTTE